MTDAPGRPKLAVVTCLGPFADHFLPTLGDELTSWAEVVPDLASVPAGAEPVVLTVPMDSPQLRAAADPAVRWMHVLATGIDGFPLELATDRTVTCSRGAAAVPIAEYTLTAMLMQAKRMPECFITEPPVGWQTPGTGTLEGATLAILGLGAIGTEVARRALSFGMRVTATRRRPLPSSLAGVTMADSLGEAVGAADHVVVTVPSTPTTARLLDAEAFGRFKPGAHLVNVSRGAVVDQDALLAALDEGQVGWATLDVVEPEPLPTGHPLYHHPRVRISPHIAWAGPVTSVRTSAAFVDNLRRYAQGQPLDGVVDPAAGY
jgi:phosphoglycerate dehydrogenase-like enzyme